MFTQISMIAYMIKFRPFKSELQEVIGVTDEFTIVFGLILIYFLYLNQDNIDTSKKLGFSIMGILVLSIFKNMSVIFYISITGSYKSFKNWVHKKLKIEQTKREKRRLERRKIREQKEKVEEQKRALDTIYMGRLSPELIFKPGQKSAAEIMKKVERPKTSHMTHLENIKQEGLSIARPNDGSLINNAVTTNKLSLQINEKNKSVMEQLKRNNSNLIEPRNTLTSNSGPRKMTIAEPPASYQPQLETVHDIDAMSLKSIPEVEKNTTD
jgi:hypothetical protein